MQGNQLEELQKLAQAFIVGETWNRLITDGGSLTATVREFQREASGPLAVTRTGRLLGASAHLPALALQPPHTLLTPLGSHCRLRERANNTHIYKTFNEDRTRHEIKRTDKKEKKKNVRKLTFEGAA